MASSRRYWLARLRPLARPVFWAPSIALLLLGLFAWEFFSRQELASFTSAPNPMLSAEEQAIGADIDSLSLLMNDIQIAPKVQPVQTAIEAAPQAPKPTQASTNRLFAASSTPLVAAIQPAQTQSPQGVFAAFKNALSTELGLSSPPQSTQTIEAANPLPPNQLQAAMEKLVANEVTVQAPIEGTARLSTPTYSAAKPMNSYSAIVEGAQPIQPGMAPVAAPLPIAPLNAPVTPTPITQPELAPVQPTPEINQQPFTTPRIIPNRPIGGGNFNTFSNP